MPNQFVLPVARDSFSSEYEWKSSTKKRPTQREDTGNNVSSRITTLATVPDTSCASKCKKYGKVIFHHLKVHAGMGLMCSVAYFDPGNWGVDLQAGAEFGYKLLFVVLFASIMAVIFQVMAAKLGCVTGLDLATHCRLLLHSRRNHTNFFHYAVLWPLYVLCEVAIIATELAELIGSATALSILFPALPLWAGVLITSGDVLFLLALGDTSGGPSRTLEMIVGGLVVTVFVSLLAVVGKVSPDWGDVFDGFVPSKTIFSSGGLYTSIAIVGATVMPHGLFLGSQLSTQGRAMISELFEEDTFEKDCLPASRSGPSNFILNWFYVRFWLPLRYMFKIDRKPRGPVMSAGHAGWPNNSLAYVKAHYWHGIVDVIGSLLGFAVIINAVILIISSAVFFNVPGVDGADVGLFQAADVIHSTVGRVMSVLFALSLLCAGQSASITATMAGQVVTEGFWQWRVSPVLRRLLARLLGLIPSLIIAVVIGPAGINTLLVASQVVLSVVLPFVAGPLVYLTSSKAIMRVKNPEYQAPARPATPDDDKPEIQHKDFSTEERVEDSPGTSVSSNVPEYLDYSNGWITKGLGWAFWAMMVVANLYVIVELAMGNS